MRGYWLPTGQAARVLGVSRQLLWQKCDRARNVDHFRGFVLGEHWRFDGSKYLINVGHPFIEEAVNG